MADLLSKGAAWLESQRRRHLSSCVQYVRGSSSVTVPATRGRSEFDLATADGALVREISNDFLIAIGDLVIDGISIMPQGGDRIIDGAVTFKVLPFGSEPSWRYADQFRLTYRIHTKQFSVESTT